MKTAAIGIDFGTTNTVVALAAPDGEAHLVSFPHDNEAVVAFRSALSFHAPVEDPSGRVVEAGPWAIDAYVEEPLVPLRGPAVGLPAADARPRRRSGPTADPADRRPAGELRRHAAGPGPG